MRCWSSWAIVALLCAALPGVGLARVEVRREAGRSVYDRAGVISQDRVELMERRHTELFQKTGVALVVVTVPQLDGEPIEDFAVRVGTEWGVGRKGEDRGIVVALAIQERRVYIATGYGVEAWLTDGRTGEILDREVVPSLRNRDYSEAMFRASSALVAAAAGEYGVSIEGVERGRNGSTSVEISPGIVFLMLLLFLIVLAFAIRHPWLFWLLFASSGRRGGGIGGGGWSGGFGGTSGFGGFGGGGFGGGGAGRGF